MKKINKFLKPIVNTLFPSLRDSFGLKMSSSPSRVTETIARYLGELNNISVTMEFSSNHVELDDYTNTNTLFLTIYYGYRGTKAGIIDLDNINEATEIIYSAFYELGYRSEQDKAEELAKEKEQQERAEQERLERLQAEKERKTKEFEIPQEEEPIEEPIEDKETESTKSLEESMSYIDNLINYMSSNNMLNGRIEASIMYDKNESTKSIISVDMFFITSKDCLVQTSNIKPKVDTLTTWEKAKDYLTKIVDKVTGVISIYGYDENNQPIEIENNIDNGDNLGIEI